MKKLTVAVASLFLSGFLMAQDYNPPAKAVSSFSAKYPTGAVQEWYEGFDEVICSFESDGMYGDAYFTLSGTWQYSEFLLDESDLPKAINEALEDDFQGYEITDVIKNETPKLTTYQVVIYSDSKEDNRMVSFNESGKIIEEVIITEEE